MDDVQSRTAHGGRRFRYIGKRCRYFCEGPGYCHGRCPRAEVSGIAGCNRPAKLFGRQRRRRSEEHTSELQSLMRISYAVFCLKKKKQTKIKRTDNNKSTKERPQRIQPRA